MKNMTSMKKAETDDKNDDTNDDKNDDTNDIMTDVVLGWWTSVTRRLMRLAFKRRLWGKLGAVLRAIKAAGQAP